MKSFEVLKEILLTEKSNFLLSEKQQYSFVVNPHANKAQIAQAVEAAFGVKVDRVNIMNYHGKPKRVRSKNSKRYTIVGSRKKAVILLKPGSKIDMA